MDTVRPLLAEIIDQVVSNAEKECVGYALAGMKMFLANRKSGLMFKARNKKYRQLARKFSKLKQEHKTRKGINSLIL